MRTISNVARRLRRKPALSPTKRTKPGRAPRLETLESRIPLAAWAAAVTSNFSTASAWNTRRVPGSTEAADILVSGSPYTVVLDRNTTVSTLRIASSSATVDHRSGLFSLAGTKLASLVSGRLNIGPIAQFRIDQGATFRYEGGVLTGVVRVGNGGTVDKSSGNSLSPGGRFLYEGSGNFVAGQLGSGQTLTVDAPINSNPGAGVTVPVASLMNNGRVELLNTRNTSQEAKLIFKTGSSVGVGTLINNGGVVALGGPGLKRVQGALTNSGTVDFGPTVQRLQVDGAFAGTNGLLRMKWASSLSFDVLDVRGTVNLSGNLQLTAPTLNVGLSAVLIKNDGIDKVVGTFANAPEGTVLVFGTQQFRVSYKGGDGNDVSVTRVNTAAQLPERTLTNPQGNVAVLSGLISDPDPKPVFRLNIDWGDGSPVQSLVFRNKSGRRAVVRHRYAAPGTYAVNVSWADEFGEGKSAVMSVSVGGAA